MSETKDSLLRKLVAFRATGLLIPLLILVFWRGGLVPPAAAVAPPDSPAVEQLKLKAEHAFGTRNYAEAAKYGLEIAEKHPDSLAHRYAVQMLGTIYEDYVVDLAKAIHWDREFLEKYAKGNQIPFYREKVAALEKLLTQEQAFKTYQAIRSADQSDEVMTQKFEALLQEHPDFLLKDKVESELGYAYGRMDQRKKSARAFDALASQGGHEMSATDQISLATADRYWKMTTTWAWVAWAVIAALWALVLSNKPWQQLTRASIRRFLLWPLLWLLGTGVGMFLFRSLDTDGYPLKISLVTVLIAAALNLVVLFWLLLLIQGKYWLTRPRARLWLSPVLALLMTSGVFYLWVAYQPDGPYIVDLCAIKCDRAIEELPQWIGRHLPLKQAAAKQGNRPEELPAKTSATGGGGDGRGSK